MGWSGKVWITDSSELALIIREVDVVKSAVGVHVVRYCLCNYPNGIVHFLYG
jgi:hypothetical protein